MPRLASGRICPGPSRKIAENRAKHPANLSHKVVLNCRAKAALPWGYTFLENISCQVLRPEKGQGAASSHHHLLHMLPSRAELPASPHERDLGFFNLLLCHWHAKRSCWEWSGLALWLTGVQCRREAVQRSPFRGTAGRASPAHQPAVALPSSHFPQPLWLMLRCCNLYYGLKMNFLKLFVIALSLPLAPGKDENKLWYWEGCCILCSNILVSSDHIAAVQCQHAVAHCS